MAFGFPAECEDEARQWLNLIYEVEYRQLLEVATQRDWEYNTNINQENADASVRSFFGTCELSFVFQKVLRKRLSDL